MVTWLIDFFLKETVKSLKTRVGEAGSDSYWHVDGWT